MFPPLRPPQLFLQRERAAVLAEAQTDDLIKEAPKAALDQSGEWQETGGEIQWVANDNSDSSRQDDAKKKKKDDEEEELDLNKGRRRYCTGSEEVHHNKILFPPPPHHLPSGFSSAACREAHGGQHRGLVHGTAAGLPVSGEPGERDTHTHTHSPWLYF